MKDQKTKQIGRQEVSFLDGLQTGDPIELRQVSAKRILEAANKVDKREKINVAGKEWDAKRVQERIPQAVAIIRTYFKNKFNADLNKVFFEQLEGNTVGEAREDGAYIDPAMLGHPAARMAHVLAHELAHANKQIMSEALVEGLIDIFMPYGIDHDYSKEVAAFKELAKNVDPNGDMKAGAEKLYDLYAKGDFEDMYQFCEKNYIAKQKTEEKKAEAFELFSNVFPEITYMGKRIGEFTLKDFNRAIETGVVDEAAS